MAWLSRSNWVSRASNTAWRREGSGSGSPWAPGPPGRPGPAFGASSWLDEVEGCEESEPPLGGGASGEDLEPLDDREGSGSIPSKRTLWRNWGRHRGSVSLTAPWAHRPRVSLSPPLGRTHLLDLAEAHPEAQPAQEELYHLIVLGFPGWAVEFPPQRVVPPTQKDCAQSQSSTQTQSPESHA